MKEFFPENPTFQHEEKQSLIVQMKNSKHSFLFLVVEGLRSLICGPVNLIPWAADIHNHNKVVCIYVQLGKKA